MAEPLRRSGEECQAREYCHRSVVLYGPTGSSFPAQTGDPRRPNARDPTGRKGLPREEALERTHDLDPIETQEWLDSLDGVLEVEGPDRAHFLINQVIDEARKRGCHAAYIDTFNPIALKTYERVGYVSFGKLDDFPKGRSRTFLQKQL